MRATVITYVNPAVATVLGVVILGEPLTVGFVVGFVLVLLGSALATRPARPARPRSRARRIGSCLTGDTAFSEPPQSGGCRG